MNRMVYRPGDYNNHKVLIRVGQTIEAILDTTARERYNCTTHKFLCGHGLSQEEFEEEVLHRRSRSRSTEILTKLDLRQIRQKVEEYYDERACYGQSDLLALADKIRSEVRMTDTIISVTIDLCPMDDDGTYLVCEVKLTADMDTGKSRETLIKNMLVPLIVLGDAPKEIYLGVFSDNQGLDNYGRWTGKMARLLEPYTILLGAALWDKFGLEGVSYEEFMKPLHEYVNDLRDVADEQYKENQSEEDRLRYGPFKPSKRRPYVSYTRRCGVDMFDENCEPKPEFLGQCV